MLPVLQALCRDHGLRDDGRDAVCVHAARHGTLSSSIVALHRVDITRWVYLYADGKPCGRDYEDVSASMREALGRVTRE